MSSSETVTLRVGTEMDTASALEKAADTTQLAGRNTGALKDIGINPPYPPEELASFIELDETHATCIHKKSRWEAGFGFDLEPVVEEPSDSQLSDLEDFWFGQESIWRAGPQGTPQTTPTEVLELARQDYHAIGWLALEIIVHADGTPKGMAHVPASEVRKRGQEVDDSGDIVTAGKGYVQREAGEKRFYGEAGDRYGDDPVLVGRKSGEVVGSAEELDGEDPANELIWIVNPSLIERWYGIPNWIPAIQTILGNQAAKQYNRDFFDHSAIPRLAVKVKGGQLTKQSKEQLRKTIKGVKGEHHRTVILEVDDLVSGDELAQAADIDVPDVDIEIEPLTQQNEEDMSFSGYRELNEHEICKVHEVPKILIQRTGTSNRSNSKEQIKDFAEDVIQPEQLKYAARLTHILHKLAFDATDWRLSFELRGANNRLQEAEIAKTRIEASQGWITVDELREELGHDRLDDELGQSFVAVLTSGAGGMSIDTVVQDMIQSEVEEVQEQEAVQRAIEAGKVEGPAD